MHVNLMWCWPIQAFGQVDFFHAFKTVELEPHNFPAYIIDYVAYSNQCVFTPPH